MYIYPLKIKNIVLYCIVVVYNGHKRAHGLKFQSVVIPNGLIAHLYGPVGELLLCLPD